MGRSRTKVGAGLPHGDVIVAVCGAIVAITCAASMDSTTEPVVASARPPPAEAAPVARVPAAASRPAPPPTQFQAPSASPAEPAPPPSHVELPHLRSALAALASGTATESVRVAWLGDSHTYADFWPHRLRQALQQKYGAGGPGYVLLGIKPYRHGQVRVKLEGKWRREPSSPSSGAKQLDGIFGLAGQRAVPLSADATASAELFHGKAEQRLRWTLLYRLPAGAALSVQVGTSASKRLTSGSAASGSPILRHTLESDATQRFTVRGAGGAPEVYGVVIETVTPGVVVDSLGVNGARAGTALVWDAPSFGAELSARRPALVVLAYGTNEAASALTGARVTQQLQALVKRVRDAVPGADCVLIGPTDMAEEGGGSRPRVAEIDAAVAAGARNASCGFVSAYGLMGGEGAFSRWQAESPALASTDRVHLTAKGYDKLGDLVLERLALP
ncbi:MAG: GDSL-type esterase/lipase family protein [Polyangiaceae bacterium]